MSDRAECVLVALWEDIMAVQGREAIYTHQVFNEAIVVPGDGRCHRALAGHVTDGAASIAMTDRALGLRRDFLRAAATDAKSGET